MSNGQLANKQLAKSNRQLAISKEQGARGKSNRQLARGKGQGGICNKQ